MRFLVTILLALAVAALPMVSATGAACRSCPLDGPHAGLFGEPLATVSGCTICHCAPAAAVAERDAAKDLSNDGIAGDAEGEPEPGHPEESSGHGCDCPIRCACGSTKAPAGTTVALSRLSLPILHASWMPSPETKRSPPHLNRLKRPPRSNGSL